jgi:hypothetical protein
MHQRLIVFLGLLAWALSPGRAVAGLTLTSLPGGPGTAKFDVNLSGVPDLASYGVDVLLRIPDASFDATTVSGNPSGTSFSVSTTGGPVVAITLDNGGSSYIFSDNSNFFGDLNTVPGHPDELEVYLSDIDGILNSMGSGLIAAIDVNTSTLAGTLYASIESDPKTLQLLDASGNNVGGYDSIQQRVAQAPPVQVTLSAVPEPSSFGLALLGFGAMLYGVRRGVLGLPGPPSSDVSLDPTCCKVSS